MIKVDIHIPRLIIDPNKDQLSVGSIAHLVEYCAGIAEFIV